MRALVCVASLLAVVSAASGANLVVNGDFSDGEAGWTRWNSSWSSGQGWDATTGIGKLTIGGQASFGWYQVIPVPTGTQVKLSGDWAATNAQWVEYDLLTCPVNTDASTIVGRLDGGAAADTAFKRDGTFAMHNATETQAGDNAGVITSQGLVVVGMKLGGFGGGRDASFDNIVLTPEPAALLLLGLAFPLIRRRRA